MSGSPAVRRLLWLLLLALPAVALVPGCSSAIPQRDPAREAFPRVTAESLAGEEVTLPDDYAGQPLVLLIAYQQRTQFDVDRWVMGLLQAEVEATILELPTVPGIAPSIASPWIDAGMRSGIPDEDWPAVVTLYGDAARPVAELTGTENGRVTRVVVLDPEGRIAWFDDEGYSPRKALEVARLVERLQG